MISISIIFKTSQVAHISYKPIFYRFIIISRYTKIDNSKMTHSNFDLEVGWVKLSDDIHPAYLYKFTYHAIRHVSQLHIIYIT